MTDSVTSSTRLMPQFIVRDLSKTWPIGEMGGCRYCSQVAIVPRPSTAPEEAVYWLMSKSNHLDTCLWRRAREWVARVDGLTETA